MSLWPCPPGAFYLVRATLPLGEVELECAVLNDEQNTRVLSAASVFKAFGRPRKGANKRLEIDGTKIPPFLASKSLEPFIDAALIEWTKPIRFIAGGFLF